MLIGYTRVSTDSQTTDPQEDELRRAGCERIFTDTASGSKADRPGLAEMLIQARKGDTIVVARLDRLGRSLIHLVETIQKLKAAGIGFRSLAEQINTQTPGGKLIFHVFSALSEFERALIAERVTAGLSAARARGRVGGRPRQDHTERERMAAAMLDDPANRVDAVCRALRVSRAHAYRLAARGRAAQVQPPPAATAPARTRKATSKAERGVPPQAAPKGGKAAASSPRQPRAATSKLKTTQRPKKATKPTSKRKP